MKVPADFKENFNSVLRFYNVSPEEKKEAIACITPETLDDAVICFKILAERVDAQKRAGIDSIAG
jgi:hypothetical protein